MALFPADLIGVELARSILRELRHYLATAHTSLFGRPARGFRADAPQTPWIVALDNQLARLDHIKGRNAPDDP